MFLRMLSQGRGVIAAIALSAGLALCAGSDAMASVTPHHSGSSSPSRSTSITWRFGAHGCSGGDCGQYLQIHNSETGDGAFAEIRNGPGDNNEHWFAMFFSSGGDWAFINANSHKCLNDRNNHQSGHVDQWSCGNFPSDNLWTENPGFPKTFALASVSNGLGACVISNDRWVVFGAIGSGSCFWH